MEDMANQRAEHQRLFQLWLHESQRDRLHAEALRRGTTASDLARVGIAAVIAEQEQEKTEDART